MDTVSVLRSVKKRLQKIIDNFPDEMRLSDWERGQKDGLYWAKQEINEVIEEIKNPPPSEE